MITMFVTALAASAQAASFGAGGLWQGRAWLPNTPLTWRGDTTLEAPGLVRCVGGNVAAGADFHRVAGGEVALCGDERARLGYGGLTLGLNFDLGPIYASARSGFGAGWMGLPYRGTIDETFFVYARPVGALGVPVKGVALEVGLGANLPVVVAHEDYRERLRGFPHLMTHLSLQFGSFAGRHED